MRLVGAGDWRWLAGLFSGMAACALCGASAVAQTADGPVYEACEPDRAWIDASELPGVLELDRCPLDGRAIVDSGVGSELPGPGEAVHVEALSTSGAQELQLLHRDGGVVELRDVGDEAAAEDEISSSELSTLARAPRECRDDAFTDTDFRENTGLSYTFARSTTPPELKAAVAEWEIVRGGENITSTRNRCGLGDRVPVELTYLGDSDNRADIGDRAECSGNEGTSEVSFGNLPGGILAVACTVRAINPAGYDEVFESDVEVNKNDFTWTARPKQRSCRNRYDLQAVMTHERGHTFGLEHVGERAHGRLTMSTRINSCSNAERTLGRGDVLGLGQKYE
jgi:hypothetical protein